MKGCIKKKLICIDSKNLNLLYILNYKKEKKVQSTIPPYFYMKSATCILYRYTSTLAFKSLNYKQLQCIDIELLRYEQCVTRYHNLKGNTKSVAGEHGPPTKAKVGSDDMEE
jgi:hypothetical protein